MSNWKVMVGGVPLDLETDYGLHISKAIGPGSAAITTSLDRYVLIPGGKVSAAKVHPRVFTLAGTLTGTSQADLHAIRQALVRLFCNGPVTLRYVGATVTKEIEARYASGLEFNQQTEDPCYWERISLQFVCPDPWWHGIVESNRVLDSRDAIAYYTVARRRYAVGTWDPMGPPNPAGGYHTVMAMALAANGDLYVGGHFTNWNNNVSGAYITRWDAATSTWNPLNLGLNDSVRGIAIAPDGMVYMVGAFTDVRLGPGGTYNRIIRWNPTTSTWSALGVGLDNDTYTISIGHDGTIYVGGYFHNAGIVPAMHVAKWNGAAWSAVDVGLNSNVFASAVGPDGGIYFAGEFNELFGLPAADYSRIIKWNPTTSTWSDVTGGAVIDDVLRAVTVSENGTIYFGGDFHNAGTLVCNHVAKSNGMAISAMGTGVDARVDSLAVGPTGLLYVGGRMHNAGDIPVSHLAIWNGYTWAHADIILLNIEAIWSMVIGDQDPNVLTNYDLYLGASTPLGNESQAGIITASNTGTAPVYPTITFTRTGGTSAKILSVRNETTGKALYFDYNLQDGETLTVTLAPTSKSIISSAFGHVQDAILPGSDFGTFALEPGDNDITCFVDVAGAPVITATMRFYNAYLSFD